MVTLSLAHYIFIFMTILILVFLIFKKEIVIPCVVGILLIGFAYTGNVVSSVQILNNAIIASNGELFGIMLVIALVTALSKAMHTVGIDELMIRPVRKIIRKPSGAFWGIGLCMLIVSWLIWPSPAVVLIGALLLPVAGRVGLPAIWAAVAMNIFGHGMGLSSDFFIQGAPAITAASAELPVTSVISASVPLWLVMSITAAAVSFFMMKREMKKNLLKNEPEITADYAVSEMKRPVLSRILAVVVTATFAAIIIAMVTMDIQGGDATALVAGAALILTCIITIAGSGFRAALSDTVDYIKEGFVFSVRICAPVLVIAAFFFPWTKGTYEFSGWDAVKNLYEKFVNNGSNERMQAFLDYIRTVHFADSEMFANIFRTVCYRVVEFGIPLYFLFLVLFRGNEHHVHVKAQHRFEGVLEHGGVPVRYNAQDKGVAYLQRDGVGIFEN